MLSNISINILAPSRQQPIKYSLQTCTNQTSLANGDVNDSIFLSKQKIILPLKQYSNKFLRENKFRDQLPCNYSLIRPKKHFTFSREEAKNKQSRYCMYKNKQNFTNTRSIKTQQSVLDNSKINKSQNLCHSTSRPIDNDTRKEVSLKKCTSIANKTEGISTSRALEKFSKVFKNQNIDRLKIRRQIYHNASDVHIKQCLLQDKQKKAQVRVGLAKNPNINPKPTINTNNPKSKRKLLFSEKFEVVNFQLQGW